MEVEIRLKNFYAKFVSKISAEKSCGKNGSRNSAKKFYAKFARKISAEKFA
jgi:hypothetical protein